MELKDRAGACKGKIGKKGNKWLIEAYATVETCQRACLDDDDCKYAVVKKSSKLQKSKCASFKKKCKLKKRSGYMVFQKFKVKASEAGDAIWKEDGGEPAPVPGPDPVTPAPSPARAGQVTPAPSPAGAAGLVLSRLPAVAAFSYVDAAEAKRLAMRSDGKCTPNAGYLHDKMAPFLTADDEPATCEDPARPCCNHKGNCNAAGIPAYPDEDVKQCNDPQAGSKNYMHPGESITMTRAAIGEPLQSSALASVITAGGSSSTPWPEFIAHAVGLQYCEAKRVTELNEDFWTWLEGRPDLLLSLAATFYPVQAKIWENMERLWTEFRDKADSLPDLGSHMVGFAFMQRKASVEVGPLSMGGRNAEGDGSPWYDNFGKDWTGGTYGDAMFQSAGMCKGLPGAPECPKGCMAPSCKGGSGPGGVCTMYCNWYWKTCQPGYDTGRHLDCHKCTGKPVVDMTQFPIRERDEHPTAIEVIRDHIKLHENPSLRLTDPLTYPWALVPYGYYGPIRECEWVRDNRGAKCPYNMFMLKVWYPEKGKEVPLSQNPFCKPDSEWNPYSLKRISEDGRVCGGCSYHNFAKHSCLGHVAGRRPEPGHSADFIFTSSGSGKSRTFSVKSPWSVTAGYKRIHGSNVAPLQLIDTLYEKNRHEEWNQEEGPWHELPSIAEAIGAGKLPRFEASRLAGMLAEHTYWYVDEATRARVLKPLAQRAAKASPNDMALLKLLFKLNSKRRSYAGRSREAKTALYGAIITESSWNPESFIQQYLDRDPLGLSYAFKNCRYDSTAKRFRTTKKEWNTGCFVYGLKWVSPSGSRYVDGKDTAFGLLETSSNSSRALLQLQDTDSLRPERMVEHLLEMEQENTDVTATPEFRGLMSNLVERLQDAGTRVQTRLLRQLLEGLPVMLVDRASPLRLSSNTSLLETCAFRMVAASIEVKFPEALPDLEATRSSVRENPTRERLKGSDDDVAGLLDWIARGKLEEEARAAIPQNDDPSDPEFRGWLQMMAAENLCDGDDVLSLADEAEGNEVNPSEFDDEENRQSSEAEGPAESDEPMVQSSGAPMVQSSPEVDACYENWLSSPIAERLKEFLDRELR